jgi:hypothetical protein
MENTIAIIAAIFCISSPIFLLTTIFLGVSLFTQKKKHEASRESERKVFIERKQLLEAKIRDLNNRISLLSSDAFSGLRLQWFDEIAHANYNSEVEVEIKFVYLFMRFLGYEISDLKTRVSIGVPVGRQKVAGIADWVVFKNQTEKPFLVIEAKEQSQKLNNAVQEQARSYAYALNAPYYMLTNGKEIIVFERKVDDDMCLFSLSVNNLPNQWQVIEQAIGKR